MSSGKILLLSEASDIFAGFPLEKLLPRVEENIKFFYSDAEYSGKEEVTELMYDNQNGERQHQLCRLYPKCFQFLIFYLLCI